MFVNENKEFRVLLPVLILMPSLETGLNKFELCLNDYVRVPTGELTGNNGVRPVLLPGLLITR